MNALAGVYAQQPYRCRLDWGAGGVRRAAARGDIMVVVDVLRFSTAATVAVAHGALIYPCAPADDAQALARRVGAEVAASRPGTTATQQHPSSPDSQEHVSPPAGHRYSLSPLSYDHVPAGSHIVLPSPNGAACLRAAREAPYVLVGALVNAQAVGAALTALLAGTALAATVVACGERWAQPDDGDGLRVAVEDYLGAGAILSHVQTYASHTHPHGQLGISPEARVCAAAFLASRDQLADLLWESISGRELRQKGLAGDVERAAQLDLYQAVPILRRERLEPFQP